MVTRDGGKTYEVISASHYQPFTLLLLEEMGAEMANNNFRIVDISGNDKITFTYRDEVGAEAVGGAKEIVRDTEINAITDGHTEYLDRITVEANVEDLPAIYGALKDRAIAIDHYYDY